ncbi:hypothetical protein ABIB06_007735 [Bradyrhizobium sp. LB8.2]|jgi:hypothetical protein
MPALVFGNDTARGVLIYRTEDSREGARRREPFAAARLRFARYASILKGAWRSGRDLPARRPCGPFRHPVRMIELANGMSVGIDDEDTAIFKRILVPAPVEIEPPGGVR